MRDCNGQCHGCAYKAGAAANSEPNNNLKGVFAALGGYPFYCHESLGWNRGRKGYPPGADNALAILTNRRSILAVGASPELVELQVAGVRKNLRVCGGWRAAVKRLKRMGWFANRDVNLVRRVMARRATESLSRLSEFGRYAEVQETGVQNVYCAAIWFVQESLEAGIPIGWLFQGGKF